MDLTTFFEQHPVFTRNECRQFLLAMGATNPHSLNKYIKYHVKKQHILRLRQGLFAVIPAAWRHNSKAFTVDPYLLAGRILDDAVIAYHSALSCHGIAPRLNNQYLYLSQATTRKFTFDGLEFICLPFAKALTAQAAINVEVKIIKRQGLPIKVTSLERTIVDMLDRPLYSGGWEAIWHAASRITSLNLDNLVKYATLLNSSTIIAKLGLFLEQHQEHFRVPEAILAYLEANKPNGNHYLERSKRETGKCLQRWNLVVPHYILQRAWQAKPES